MTQSESSEWDQASLWTKWTFSVANPILNLGMTRQLNFNDLLKLPANDETNLIVQKIDFYYHHTSSIFGIPRLLITLIRAVSSQFILVGLYYLLEGILRIICTILLGLFLKSLQDSDAPLMDSLLIALLLSLCNLLQNFIHHVSFYFSMKMGNNMKIGTIGFIYDRLFEIKGAQLQEADISSGQLVNLISNDVQRFEEWSVVSVSLSLSLPLSLSLSLSLCLSLSL
jgi:hypothetical protein